MIASSDDQASLRNTPLNLVEGLDQQLQPLVSSPLAERQNAMLRVAAPLKAGQFRTCRKNAVRAEMHVVAVVLFNQRTAIPGSNTETEGPATRGRRALRGTMLLAVRDCQKPFLSFPEQGRQESRTARQVPSTVQRMRHPPARQDAKAAPHRKIPPPIPVTARLRVRRSAPRQGPRTPRPYD